ncbi:MAG: hypothetical protein V7704_22720 [Aurantimonas endophytica]|uniref:hypothetical protein n=1 Tax=Aurantimonas endophytica TaxID=1522175 RepID=UPI0030033055
MTSVHSDDLPLLAHLLKEVRVRMLADQELWAAFDEIVTQSDIVDASVNAVGKALVEGKLTIVRDIRPDDNCHY